MDHPDPLNGLERQLAGLKPSPLAIDRDRMMYLAGRASAAQSVRGRLAGAASLSVLAILCGGIAVMFATERGRRIELERLVAERSRKDSANPRLEVIVAQSPPAPSSYLALSQMGFGPDEEPSAPLASDPVRLAGSMYREPPLSPLSARARGGLAEF